MQGSDRSKGIGAKAVTAVAITTKVNGECMMLSVDALKKPTQRNEPPIYILD